MRCVRESVRSPEEGVAEAIGAVAVGLCSMLDALLFGGKGGGKGWGWMRSGAEPIGAWRKRAEPGWTERI